MRLERVVMGTAEAELKQFGASFTDYLTLMTLHPSRSGNRLISSPARGLMVHLTTATLAVDRLEGRGPLARSTTRRVDGQRA